MKSINEVRLLGFLGNAPTVSKAEKGQVATFSMATSVRVKGSNEERTEWHQIVMFDPFVDVYGTLLKKGSRVFIEGWLKTTTREVKGAKRSKTEVVVTNVIDLEKRAAA